MSASNSNELSGAPQKLSDMTLSQLSDAMMLAAENEDYEEAARIKAEIEKRNTQNDNQ